MEVSKGDEMLIAEIKADNKIAFEAMVLKYRPKLMSVMIGYTKSRDQAEELCQKTFIRVWQKIHTFKGESSLFTWIYRIGINLAKNDFASSYSKNLKITAFTLREIEGRSYDEIAKILNCPIGTVRSRIFRARQLILEFINKENIFNE